MSTIAADNISNLAGTASTAMNNAINGSAKAWVNFNGRGTVSIRASFNVSSITDNGVGKFAVNFTNALSSANYSITASCSFRNSDGSASLGTYVLLHVDGGGASYVAPTTSSFTVGPSNYGAGACDSEYVNVSVFI